MAHATQMSAGDTGLLIIDVQEKLMPLMATAPAMIRNAAFLIDAACLLDIPVVATEQYPRGLGSTVPELAGRLPVRPDKTAFSCCAIPSVVETFHRAARPKVVLAGVEAHVCVLHTALDLLALDFRVYIPVDAVASRAAIDYEYGLRRAERAGAILTTSETCAFEWVGGSSHPRFKDISKLVQARAQQMKEQP